jgi:hypothetical protein
VAEQLYSRPGDNVAQDATPTLATGTVAGGSAIANINDLRPGKATRLTGTSGTFRFTFGAPVELVAMAICNHNLAGASVALTNSGGGGGIVGLPVPVAANGSDDQCVNPWLSFDGSVTGHPVYLAAARTSSVWDVAITGALLGNVAVGEILLLTALRDLRWMWGVKFWPGRYIVSPGTTFGESHLRYNKRIRRRRFSGTVQLQTEEQAMRLLEAEAQGEYHGWLLVPKVGDNDCQFVQFNPGSFSFSPKSIGSTDMTIEGTEVSSGPPLFA